MEENKKLKKNNNIYRLISGVLYSLFFSLIIILISIFLMFNLKLNTLKAAYLNDNDYRIGVGNWSSWSSVYSEYQVSSSYYDAGNVRTIGDDDNFISSFSIPTNDIKRYLGLELIINDYKKNISPDNTVGGLYDGVNFYLSLDYMLFSEHYPNGKLYSTLVNNHSYLFINIFKIHTEYITEYSDYANSYRYNIILDLGIINNFLINNKIIEPGYDENYPGFTDNILSIELVSLKMFGNNFKNNIYDLKNYLRVFNFDTLSFLHDEEVIYDFGFTAGYDDGYELGIIYGKTFDYDDGYDDGYIVGYDDGEVDGIFIGYEGGYDDGYELGIEYGYNDGFNNGAMNGMNLNDFFPSIIGAITIMFSTFLNAEIFGYKLWYFFSIFLLIGIVLLILKLINGGKS